jgi:hypothetical protein
MLYPEEAALMFYQRRKLTTSVVVVAVLVALVVLELLFHQTSPNLQTQIRRVSNPKIKALI